MSIAVLSDAAGSVSIAFEVNADLVRTWQDARRSGSARWATHEIIMGKPKKEFVGPGLDRITLSVRLDMSQGVVPKDEMQKMREQRDAGTVLQFTVGGALVADVTIETVDEEWRRMSNAGVLLVAVVQLTLEEYA